MSDRTPPPGRPSEPRAVPPTDPPTDPGTSGIYGPVPPGWRTEDDGPRPRRRWSWPLLAILLGTLLVVGLVLLVWLLGPGDPSDGGDGGDGGDRPGPAGRALPTPTLTIVSGGFRYSIGVGPFTPAIYAPGRPGGRATVPPGRHVLQATVVVRNDTDRPAPAWEAPALWVGLAGVAELAPVHSIGIPRMVSDCLNDDRNPRVFRYPPPPRYRGLTPPTCIVQTRTAPAGPAASSSERTLAPGAVSEAVVTTIDIPDTVPADRATAWIPTSAAPDGATVLDPIPR